MVEAPQWMFTKALSHRQKVLRLFKKSMRMVESWHLGEEPGSEEYLEMRYHQVVLRNRFDMHAKEKDMNKSRQLLIDGCRELWEKKRYGEYSRFSLDPGGIAVDRELEPTDWLMDTWPYFEREQFPYYYNRRELRKKELVEHWEKIQEAWDEELASIQRRPPPK